MMCLTKLCHETNGPITIILPMRFKGLSLATLRGLLFKSGGFLFQFCAIFQLTLKLARHLT